MEYRHVILSGCSGGGKSTLLAELARRGFAVVEEPGRRIVEQELRSDGGALPWVDLAAFARRALDLAAEDRRRMSGASGWVFFDRGLVDAAVALQHATGEPAATFLAGFERYHQIVFLAPPWPRIYVNDTARQHGLADAIAEYDRLEMAYADLGYQTLILPKTSVQERVEFVVEALGWERGSA